MFDAAIAAAQPALCIPACICRHPGRRGRLVVIGAGKASAAMARAVERNWPGKLEGPGGHALRLRGAVRAHRDRRGGAPGARCGRPRAARRMLDLVRGLTPTTRCCA
jgi:glycerate 2-kinase